MQKSFHKIMSANLIIFGALKFFSRVNDNNYEDRKNFAFSIFIHYDNHKNLIMT